MSSPAEPSLPDKVVALNEALASSAVLFAFGGALALAYYAEPRATMDIDVNVFVPPDDLAAVRAALAPLTIRLTADDAKMVRRAAQVRLWWGNTPVDLFFAYDDFHHNAGRRVRRVPFGERTIPVLAAEDLLVCKAVFDRTKDWIDIDQMLLLTAGTLDIDDVRGWLTRIVRAGDARIDRFDRAVDRILGGQPA
jgi:hypothetical protein